MSVVIWCNDSASTVGELSNSLTEFISCSEVVKALIACCCLCIRYFRKQSMMSCASASARTTNTVDNFFNWNLYAADNAEGIVHPCKPSSH